MSHTLDLRQVKLANDPRKFPLVARITREDGSVGRIEPTPLQRMVLDTFPEHPWTYTVKHRQAKMSTIHVADALRHVAYTPGHRGLVVADIEKTAKELMRRMISMYDHLPAPIQPQLLRPPSSEAMEYRHGGLATILSGNAENPAIGHSPDYAVISEYGLFQDADNFNGAFFPSISKRLHAICRIETTPGAYMSPQHLMWIDCLAGKGRFKPNFLGWWLDDTCTARVPKGFQRDSTEEALAAKMPGITDAHFMFRRLALDTEFHGDARLWDTKYPPDPYSGWATGASVTIPLDALIRQMNTPGRVLVPDDEEHVFEQREFGAPYVLTADGAGFGETGDPSSLKVWNAWDRREAACWAGRTDPGSFADRIMKFQKMYDADVVVEANKGEVCQALLSRNCPKMYWDRGQPGWFSTDVSKAYALTSFVDMLRQDDIAVMDRQTLLDAQTWDGKTRSKSSKTRKHHWDRVITCLIAAFAFRSLGYGTRPRVAAPRPAGIGALEFLAGWSTKRNDVLGGS